MILDKIRDKADQIAILNFLALVAWSIVVAILKSPGDSNSDKHNLEQSPVKDAKQMESTAADLPSMGPKAIPNRNQGKDAKNLQTSLEDKFDFTI